MSEEKTIRLKKDGTPYKERVAPELINKLPDYIRAAKVALVERLDFKTLAYAAALKLSGNAVIEVIGGMPGIEKYYVDILNAIYFGKACEGVNKAGIEYYYELPGNPELLEEMYKELPEELKAPAKVEGEKVKKVSVVQALYQMVIDGAAELSFFEKNAHLRPRQLAFLKKMVAQHEAGEEVSIADESIDEE